jgi:hypothetical protein
MPGILVAERVLGSTHRDRPRRGPERGIDRPFRSLPMARSARAAQGAPFPREELAVCIVIVIGYLVGLQSENGLFLARSALAWLVLASLRVLVDSRPASAWRLKQGRGRAGRDSFHLIFPVVFVSSAYRALAGMSGSCRWWPAQPGHHLVQLARYLSSGSVAIVTSRASCPSTRSKGWWFKSAA